MKKYQLISLLWLIAASVYGQDLIDLRTQTKNVDFSGAASTIPARIGTTLPATCNLGEVFFKTNNTGGQNLFSCAPANTWTSISSSANGTVSTATSGQFGFYSASGNTIIGHTLTASDIPALNYQSPISFTGNGGKTVSSTGTLMNGDCAKWDANGNAVDSGSPCASVASGGAGQFAFYSTAGAALSAHTLAASDIPALNYQLPLTFTGSGSKTVSNITVGSANNCAKWDSSGNIADAGNPCGTVASGAAGQFAFYSASGSALSAHTLAASDIPALNYQSPLSFTGSGAKTISSTAAGTSGNCAKWDANGNVVDAGAPCGTGSGSSLTTPTTTVIGNIPQYGSANGSILSFGVGLVTSVGSSGSNSNVPTEAAVRSAIAAAVGSGSGSGGITAPSSTTIGNIPQYSSATGSALSAGLGLVTSVGSSGSNTNVPTEAAVRSAIVAAVSSVVASGGGITAPSSTTIGNIPQYSSATGSALSVGLGLVTSVGSSGSNTNVPTEAAVRSAIAAAVTGTGQLPSQTGNAGYLITNGTTASWGDLTTGPSGALCAGTGCSGGTPGIIDIVTSVVPRLSSANTFTGVNKFQQLQLTVYTVSTLPACNASFEGQMEGVSDAVSPSYLATVTGGGSVHVPVYCNGTSWVAH